MRKNLLSRLTALLLLTSCTDNRPNITVVCEENSVGNCIIKWEVKPALKGLVKVYASTTPDFIAERIPVAIAPISGEKITIIPDDPAQRYYYLMVFDNKYRIKTATRNINIPGVQNFRDLGGYPSFETGKAVHWGMIYRSAQIEDITPYAIQELKNMGIRTVIDLRSDEERPATTSLHKEGFNMVHIPLPTGNIDYLLQGVREGKIKADTIYRSIEQINRGLVTNYRKEFRRLFTILLDRNCYPAVIHCTSGKGRTGVFSALLLASLGVDEDIIMKDYRLSNDFFNIPNVSKYAYQLPPHSQEAITTIYSAKEDFLNAAKEQIESEYGNVRNYLEKGIGLSKEEIKRLRSILLTED